MQYPPSSHSNYTSGSTKDKKPSLPWRIKIVMECLRTILRDECKTVRNNPLLCSSPTSNPSYLATYQLGTFSGNNKSQCNQTVFTKLITIFPLQSTNYYPKGVFNSDQAIISTLKHREIKYGKLKIQGGRITESQSTID